MWLCDVAELLTLKFSTQHNHDDNYLLARHFYSTLLDLLAMDYFCPERNWKYFLQHLFLQAVLVVTFLWWWHARILENKIKQIKMRTEKNRMPDYALKLAGFGPRPPDVWQRQRRQATWGADVAFGHPKNWEPREPRLCLCTWQSATHHFPRTPSPCGNEGSADIHRSFVYIYIYTYHHSSKWNRTLCIMAVTTNRGF